MDQPIVTHIGQPDWLSISCFAVLIFVTLLITYWAARRTKGTDEFFTAGRSITGFQNGMAITGDFVSASSFLGFTGLIALYGFDGLIYTTAGLMGWPLVLFLLAEPLRNLGRYTFTDVLAFRLQQVPIRIAASISGLSVTLFYMISQMIGGGYLIKLMFGLSYETAEIIVGMAMICYVMFGGMLATTWVQIIKAALLLGGAAVLSILVLAQFNFNPITLMQTASDTYGSGILVPGSLYANSLDAVSLALAFMLGTAGLPHVLMRFYTVPDAQAARSSAFYATGFIGAFYIMTFIMGFGAMVIVGQDVIKHFEPSGNMSVLLMSEILGGDGFLGFISAATFATILAVVAGLTLSGAATLSHDLYANVIKKGKSNPQSEMRVARISTCILGLLAIVLGIVFKGQNVAIPVGLAFSIAASANFPALILAVFWRKATTKGVVSGIAVGTVGSLALIYLSPIVQIEVLGKAEALFPFKNPAIFVIPVSFFVGIVVSLLTKDPEADKLYEKMQYQIHHGQAPAPVAH